MYILVFKDGTILKSKELTDDDQLAIIKGKLVAIDPVDESYTNDDGEWDTILLREEVIVESFDDDDVDDDIHDRDYYDEDED